MADGAKVATAQNLPSDLAVGFFKQLQARPSERVVVTVFAAGAPPVLSHASVLVGPPSMASRSWPDWSVSQGQRQHESWCGGPARFCVEDGERLLARSSLTPRQARLWLTSAIAGKAPKTEALPAVEVHLSQKPVRFAALMRGENESWSSKFVLGAARPVEGFLLPLSDSGGIATDEIAIGSAKAPPFIHLGIDIPDLGNRTGERAAPALVFGRVSRQAWIANARFGQNEPLGVELRAERGGLDLRSLRLVIREYADDELVAAAMLAIRDVRTPARVRTKLWIKAPTTGRGVGRSLELYTDDGTLLDARDRFHFVEQIRLRLKVDGHDTPPITIGDSRPLPDVAERLKAVERRRAEWDSWLRRGLRYRVITDTAGVESFVRARIRSAPGELLIVDPYFGKGGQGWNLLTTRKASTRVLTGRDASLPSVPLPWVRARSLPTPPPYHDRVYVWQGGGLSIGASAGGFAGKRAFRIDHLGTAESLRWRALFETWWADKDANPV